MLEKAINLDKKLFLWLNGLNDPQLDPIFWYISQTSTWIPLYAVFLIAIFYVHTLKFTTLSLKQTISIFAAIGIAVLLADQITSGFMKPFFERLRPSHDPSIRNLVHLVAGPDGNLYRGGQFGFASSHAANSFAIASLVSTLVPLRWVDRLVVGWAILVSYSRIYLGVHYPGDILAGALIGGIIGRFVAQGYFYINPVDGTR